MHASRMVNGKLYMVNCTLQCLHVVQLLVVAILLYQFFVGATFHNLSFVEHINLVGILDGGKTMGNGDGGA